jgi:YidC/Oxa1 family membrane protein insertase
MQDQGKRLLIAVALALGVMFAWQTFFAPKDEKKPPPTTAQGSQVGSAAGSNAGSNAVVATVPSSVGVSTQPSATPAAPVARGPEVPITLTFPNFVATFSNYGGVLKQWHLTDKRYDKDKNKGDLLPQAPSTGVFGVNFASSTFVLPAETEWTGTKVSDREVLYTYTNDKLTIEKRFVVIPESYIVKATITTRVALTPGAEARQVLAVTAYGFQDPKDDGGGGKSVSPRRWESATFRRGEHLGTTVANVQKHPRYEYNVVWTGYEHPYLLVGLAPKPINGLVVEKQTSAQGNEGLMRTDILFHPATTFKADSGPSVYEIGAYLGPKNYNQLESADTVLGYTTHFKDTIDLGWFGFIGRPLMWLLLQFYAFFQNWGLSIVLLTICVKAVTIPFTTKSMRSMKAMAVLAPEMKSLQEKYKEDKQRLQMETMALYKQHGANPLTGCLPMFIQMPIGLALYRMLSATGEMYRQPFIHGWIDDLTNSDPYHVLPIILMATMFVQARLTPMGPSTDPSQKMQQRMMQYGMPLMFGVMSFFFPAGLTLYIFTNTCLSAVHSIWMNKYDKKSIALAERLKAAHAKAEQSKNQTAAAKAKDANVDDDDDDDDGSSTDDKSLVKTAANKPRPNQNRGSKKKKRRR